MTTEFEDTIAKHCAKIIFVSVESQMRCATLSAIIVCHSKTNDIRVGIHHYVFYMKSTFLLVF